MLTRRKVTKPCFVRRRSQLDFGSSTSSWGAPTSFLPKLEISLSGCLCSTWWSVSLRSSLRFTRHSASVSHALHGLKQKRRCRLEWSRNERRSPSVLSFTGHHQGDDATHETQS